jgi:flavin reductase (DIM6/NTAB) family NADH-FMN oxidoreductase RutF
VSERPTVELRRVARTRATSRLPTGAIVPRPVPWITTHGDRGGLNLAPFSAFTLVSASPLVVGFAVVARRTGATTSRRVDEFVFDSPAFERLDTLAGSSHASVTSPPFALGALVDIAAERTTATAAS